MRSFFAIDLPEDVKAAIEQLSQRLRQYGAKASWVPPQRMHLTVRFLGDISEGQRDGLLKEVPAVLEALEPLKLAIRGTGSFGKRKKPEIVWVGVEIREGDIDSLVHVLNEAGHRQGLPADDKPFRPHITLARIRDTRTAGPLAEALENEGDFAAGEFTCHNVTLYESKLSPQGPNYSVVRKFFLGAS